jgi:5'-3' exonuclease
MGIPSYYRKLARNFKGIYCSRPEPIEWMLMDYNCLIYQVLRDSSLAPYPGMGPMGQQWELEFIDEICKYTRKIIEMAGAPEERVLIAMDGVVPMAKMRQQRMRRFKSVALSAHAPTWDTNAITPGTNFMKTLAAALKKAFPEAKVSDTEEFGEGEHKLMEFLKSLKTEEKHGNVVIYGLDGDLFVLALLNNQLFCPEVHFYFLREEAEKDKPLGYSWLSLDALKIGLESAAGTGDPRWLTEYAIAMSLLGNDFVPHGLSFRIKEGGHERLLDYLRRLHSEGLSLIGLEATAWSKLFSFLAADEKHFVLRSAKSKMDLASKIKTYDEENKPLEWASANEGQLLDGERLVADWQSVYARVALGSLEGLEAHYLEDSARQYIHALEWTYNYYCKGTDSVSFMYMYNYPTAPLFEAVAAVFNGFDLPAIAADERRPTAHEQLALVLPSRSYWLIPKCKERKLFAAAPQLFPSEWQYYSFGKRFFWECEPEIPIPTIQELRELL